MNISSVRSLFAMFYGGEPDERFDPLISLAVSEVERMLLPDADPDDKRLDFLCASLANCRAVSMLMAGDTRIVTSGGLSRSGKRPDPAFTYAQKLLYDYMDMCSDLIKPKSFIFVGISTGDDIPC